MPRPIAPIVVIAPMPEMHKHGDGDPRITGTSRFNL